MRNTKELMIVKETYRVEYKGIRNEPMVIVEKTYNGRDGAFTTRTAYTKEFWEKNIKDKNKKKHKINLY